MGKKEKLLLELGDHMSESVGVMESHEEKTSETLENRSTKFLGRTRSRSAGNMSLEQIVADPDQPRKQFDKAELLRLSESLKRHGVLQAIRVRWSEELEKWMIVSGERRFQAAKLAELSSIPCLFVEDDVEESEIRAQQLVENCQREDLAPIEQARAFRALMDLTSWSTQRLATELNLSKATVVRSLALLKLPDEIQQQVEEGELAPSTAYAMSQVSEKSAQLHLAQKASENRLTRDEVKKIVNAKMEHERPIENQTKTKQFQTRYAVITIEHRKADASPADFQEALLAVVKQIGHRKIGDDPQ